MTAKDDVAYCCNTRYQKGINENSLDKSRDTHIIVVADLNHYGNEQMNRVYSPDGVSPTLCVVSGGGREMKVLVKEKLHLHFRVRRMTPREYARLQGFPDSYKFVVSDSQLYKIFGNAITVHVGQAMADACRRFLHDL